jgi:hypothetical protein
VLPLAILFFSVEMVNFSTDAVMFDDEDKSKGGAIV